MKNIYCTLDTETFGGAVHPKGIYHIGGVVHDRQGNVMASFNYLIAEHYDEIDKDDYGKKNFDRYAEMIGNSTISTMPTEDLAIEVIDRLLKHYNVNYMLAYNSGFDYVRTKCSKLLENRQFIDIQLMACEIFGQRPSYIKFCKEHNYLSSSKKCIALTAESFYAFLTNNGDYHEEHTALEDSLIEKYIFECCVKTHKKYTQNCHYHNAPKGCFKFLTKVS